MIMNEREGTKYPRSGGMGKNTPFAKQSRKKEQDNGHDTNYQCLNLVLVL